MNAQEAIEKKQMYVDMLKSRVSDLEKEIGNPYRDSKHFSFVCRRKHAELQRELEMESIVLESAKKFHNSCKTEVHAENKLLYYDFSSTVYPEELDELGIDKGADE